MNILTTKISVPGKNKIDVIIPAWKAHGTIMRTLCSIAMQSIVKDLHVMIVNDACPEGSYREFIDVFRPYMNIEEVLLRENGGPGVARQAGVDRGTSEFFCFIDADDTYAGPVALEILRSAISDPVKTDHGDIPNGYQCVAGAFVQLGPDVNHTTVTHLNNMISVFGKLYRRSFIKKYDIRFSATRANEDGGYNTTVRLLCDRPAEQVRHINDVISYWHYREDSITRINNHQYTFDQNICGIVDNMIYALNKTKHIRPANMEIDRYCARMMCVLYYQYVMLLHHLPVFKDQCFEYLKKYYHNCYAKFDISDEMFAEEFVSHSRDVWSDGNMEGVVPQISIREFMHRLETEPYDPDDIYDVWDALPAELKENNIKSGVCPKGYYDRPASLKKEES